MSTAIKENDELIADLEDFNEDEENDSLKSEPTHANKIEDIVSTIRSEQIQECLLQIEALQERKNIVDKSKIESSDEYKLIITSNKLLAKLETDETNCYNYIKQNYSKRFPELESLVSDRLLYSKAVRLIGNNKNLTKLELSSFLSAATVMVINVSMQTTKGTTISDKELDSINKATELMFEIEEKRTKIINFVKSQVNLLVPNLSNIVGVECAAHLLTAAGGIIELIKIPACNILAIGNYKREYLGYSKTSTTQNAGYIYNCEFVQSYPNELKKQVARIVASKSVLAMRADYARSALDGSIGKKLKEEMTKRLDKIQEPNHASKGVKPLPVPNDGPKKRRGGKRYRKLKEAYEVTELRKMQNRMKFGDKEDEVEGYELSKGLGMLKNSGQVRANVVDIKTKTTLSKRYKHILQQHNGKSLSKSNGSLTSLAFTPVQGIELQNPNTKNDQKDTKYFNEKCNRYMFVEKNDNK